MCGRSSLHDDPVNLLEHFHLPPALPGFKPRYNIAPTQEQWTLFTDVYGQPAVRERKWGLVPSWASDPSIGNRMINARGESVLEKPAYRDLMSSRRCLILADGYYEWMGFGKTKVPLFFHMTGHRAFPLAGLWDRWERGGTTLETCTIITTEAGSRTSAYHHRMPVILATSAAEEWLDSSTPHARLSAMLTSYEAADLECYEVSRLVNTPANDSPECILPASGLSA